VKASTGSKLLALTCLIGSVTQGCALAAVPQAATTLTSIAPTQQEAGRKIQHVTLADPRFGKIGFAISLPETESRHKLPVVFVLGALGSGQHSVGLIHDAGAAAIVGYDWPALPRRYGLRAIVSLQENALAIPSRMSALSRWTLAQPWADPRRVTLVGFSLGAIAAPAAEDMMQAQGTRVRWTVLADGGAPISAVVAGDQQIQPPWLRNVAAAVAESLFRPMDPALHVSHLSGRFLLISSADDTTIPRAASQRLEELAPQPKQMIQLPGGHVGTSGAKLELLNAAVVATRRWLTSQGAI
jgi:pimeloyl-ACP methyl ester carboxylesterase